MKVAFAVLIALAGSAGFALADDAPPSVGCHDNPADCRLYEGLELRKRGQFAEAADKFLAAYELEKSTSTYALYADALAQSKQYVQARAAWETVVTSLTADLAAARAATPPVDEAIATLSRQLDGATGQLADMKSHTVRVSLKCAAACPIAVTRGSGADVAGWKDGLVVTAGSDSLKLVWSDGQKEDFPLKLTPPTSDAPVVVTVPDHVPPKPVVIQQGPAISFDDTATRHSHKVAKVFFYSGIVAAVAGAGLGGYAIYLGRTAAANECNPLACTPHGHDLVSQSNTFALGSDIAIGGALVLGVIAYVVYTTAPNPVRRKEGRVGVVPSLTPDGGGVLVRGSF